MWHAWERRKVYKALMGKPKGKRPLRRLRRRWQYVIRMHLRETGLEGVGWIQVSQDKGQWRGLVNMMMKNFSGSGTMKLVS
jgi:hypothetical protein